MMKISQIGSKQYVHDPPLFLNRHKKKNDFTSTSEQFSTKTSVKKSNDLLLSSDNKYTRESRDTEKSKCESSIDRKSNHVSSANELLNII